MSLLRWILLIAGVVLIAAIYIWGLRNRRTQPSDRFDGRASTPPRQQSRGEVEALVPELGDTVVVRTREVERPLTITSSDAALDTDDLPPMHAGFTPAESGSSRDEAPRELQLSELSTGSFIAMQAQRTGLVQAPAEAGHEPIGTATTQPEMAELQTSPRTSSLRPQLKKPPSSRKIVALRLSAGSGRVDGSRLKELLEGAGLRHGKYSIYHRMDADDAPIFSVASMVEPGTFDPYAMHGVQFPGVTIFAQISGALDGDEVFERMLACARELEQGIGGLLQDERGMPLTEQREQRLRDDVADFIHLLGQK